MNDKPLLARDDVREVVRQKYGEAALRVLQGQSGACCGSETDANTTCCGEVKSEGACCGNSFDPITGYVQA